MKAITAVVVVAIASAGCSTLKSEPIVQGYGKNKWTIGTVTTWSPDKAAAVVLGDKACMQLPTRLVNLGTSGGGAGTVNVPGEVNAGGGGAGDFRSDATSALVATERTTFLSFGLFYMCQMAMNKSIGEATLKDMLSMVVQTSATLEPPPIQPPAFVVAEHFTMHAPPPEKPVEASQEEQSERVTPAPQFSIEE